MAVAQLELGTLPRSDGSASYTAYGCTVMASVHGPVEVNRRDELPAAATIDVTVRPAAGIGGTRFPSVRSAALMRRQASASATSSRSCIARSDT